MSALILIVLAGCTSTEKTEADVVSKTHVETLALMIPTVPEPPHLPELEWSHQDGHYQVDEKGADALLDYAENQLAGYRDEVDRVNRVLEIIKAALIDGSTLDEGE